MSKNTEPQKLQVPELQENTMTQTDGDHLWRQVSVNDPHIRGSHPFMTSTVKSTAGAASIRSVKCCEKCQLNTKQENGSVCWA